MTSPSRVCGAPARIAAASLASRATSSRSGVDSGNVYVHYGPVTGHVATEQADFTLEGQVPGDAVGTAVAATDLDDDRYADLVAGAALADYGGTDAGAAFVVYGGGL